MDFCSQYPAISDCNLTRRGDKTNSAKTPKPKSGEQGKRTGRRLVLFGAHGNVGERVLVEVRASSGEIQSAAEAEALIDDKNLLMVRPVHVPSMNNHVNVWRHVVLHLLSPNVRNCVLERDREKAQRERETAQRRDGFILGAPINVSTSS